MSECDCGVCLVDKWVWICREEEGISERGGGEGKGVLRGKKKRGFFWWVLGVFLTIVLVAGVQESWLIYLTATTWPLVQSLSHALSLHLLPSPCSARLDSLLLSYASFPSLLLSFSLLSCWFLFQLIWVLIFFLLSFWWFLSSKLVWRVKVRWLDWQKILSPVVAEEAEKMSMRADLEVITWTVLLGTIRMLPTTHQGRRDTTDTRLSKSKNLKRMIWCSIKVLAYFFARFVCYDRMFSGCFCFSLFKECPHPDEKQRLELSRRLSLETRQVKFWFQNRRTQMKVVNPIFGLPLFEDVYMFYVWFS